MAYYPKTRNVSGVFYYGTAGSDQILETNSTFTYDVSTNVANVTSTGITVGGITNQIEASTGNGSDYMLIASGTALRKLPLSTLSASLGGGTMNNWLVSANNGSTQTVSDTNQVDFSGAGNITITQDEVGSPYRVVISGNDQVNTYTAGSGLNEDPSQTFNVQTDNSTLEVSADIVKVKNGGITPTQLATSVAGNGLTGGAGSALSVGAGSLIDVTATTVDVDLTEAAAATIADNDYLIFLDGGAAGAESKGSTRDLASLLAGAGLTATNSTLSLTNSSVTVQGDSGSTTLSLGEILDIVGGSGISTTVTAGSPERVTVNLTALGTAGTYGSASETVTLTVDNNGRITSASEQTISITSSEISDFNSASESAIFTTANFVDSSTVDFTVSAGVSVTASVPDSGITEVKRRRTVDSSFTNGEVISSDINLVDATAGNILINLPAPPVSAGRLLYIKKIDSSSNTVTIDQNSSETIDGGTQYLLYNQYEAVTLICDGTNWHVF